MRVTLCIRLSMCHQHCNKNINLCYESDVVYTVVNVSSTQQCKHHLVFATSLSKCILLYQWIHQMLSPRCHHNEAINFPTLRALPSMCYITNTSKLEIWKFCFTGPFKCYVTIFSGNMTPSHPLLCYVTLEWPLLKQISSITKANIGDMGGGGKWRNDEKHLWGRSIREIQNFTLVYCTHFVFVTGILYSGLTGTVLIL